MKTVVSSSNWTTESILLRAWGHDALNVRNLKSIFKLHGQMIFRHTYPLGYPNSATFNKIKPLNAIDYYPFKAKLDLLAKWDFRDYGLKHWENIFTKIYQTLILPKRWGFDKRRSHFSSNIYSGHMERSEALRQLEVKPPFREKNVVQICKALNIEASYFHDYIYRTPKRSHLRYDFYKLLQIRAKIQRLKLRLHHAQCEIIPNILMGEQNNDNAYDHNPNSAGMSSIGIFIMFVLNDRYQE